MKNKGELKILVMLILTSILCVNLISATEGDYISSFSIGDQAVEGTDIATDGINIWVLVSNRTIYKYDMDGNYLDIAFDISSFTTQTYGITTDGINIWIADPSPDLIIKLDMSGNNLSSWGVPQFLNPSKVATDGTNIWAVSNNHTVYKYDMDGVYANENWLSTSSRGITTDGTNIWQANHLTDEVYRYNITGGNDTDTHWDISSQSNDVWGITTDDISIWIIDYEDDEVYKYEGAVAIAEIQINLISPTNNLALSVTGANFTANYTATGYNFTNVTYHVWNSTGIFNNSVIVNITGTSNSTTEYIDDFILGNYEWNVLACWENATFSNCSFADANYSFSVGATINEITYNSNVYETSSQTFTANITLLSGSEMSLAQFVYNGTIYDISNILTRGGDLLLNKTIDIPKNPGSFINATNTFWFSFTYTNGVSTNQNTSSSSQNVSFINLQLCNATYNIQSINFSLKDEITKSLIDPAANNTNVQVTFEYWLGGGTEVKNYSFSRLNSATNKTYEFCIYPNKTFKVNMDLVYSAQAYDERTYILRNASITNITSVIDLFLLYENLATKFTIEVRQGVSILKDAVVTVARFFTGEGSYRTISIRETDSAGEFVEYLDLDNDYRYSIVKNGVLLGVIDKKATCTEAPCEFTLQIAEDIGNIFEGYEDNYALNVLSNLSFDLDTKIVSYDFIDITGLAQYFRLRVTRGAYNGTGVEICNQQIFSSSGSMTCNVTGYEGNFVAVGTVSRSPELIDQILEFVLGTLRDSLGLMAIVFSFAIILTLTIAGAVLSGGNPNMVLGGFGLGLLATKLMTLLPFSWGLVALFELIILIIMGWLKT